MREARDRFFTEVLPDLRKRNPDVDICELHRISGFRPPKGPKSDNPVLARKPRIKASR